MFTDYPVITHLVSAGLLTLDQARHIVAQAKREVLPLGQILLEAGILTLAQVMNILSDQADAPLLRFGEIAMARRMITPKELEWALEQQSKARSHPLTLLIRAEDIPREMLLLSLCDYIEEIESAVQERRAA